jgi:hypothetical protein
MNYDCRAFTGTDPWKLIGKSDGHIRKLIRSTITGDAVPAYIKDMGIAPATKAELVDTILEWVQEQVWEQMDESDIFAPDIEPDLFDQHPEQMRLQRELA